MAFELPSQPQYPPSPSLFTAEQITTYLAYIGIPYDKYPTCHDIAYLTLLQEHQLATIPYENLTLHYSQNHRVTLDPQHLYDKMMKNGRGGFCMENCIFFRHILAALGFSVYTTGARIRLRENNIPQGAYIGWVHCVNIVTLPNGERYMVDVSFGGDGPSLPLPLKPGHISHNIGTQKLRLLYDNIPGQSIAGNTHSRDGGKMWVYQYQNRPEQDWNSYYAFPEMEFLPGDLEWMAEGAQSTALSFQTWTVLGVKFLMSEQEIEGKNGRKIYGKVMLAGDIVKTNTGGKTQTAKECKTEADRVQALKDYFGIILTNDEIIGIVGTKTEIR